MDKRMVYNEFSDKIGRLTRSTAYLDFCEEVYGYREYMFNMLDNEQIKYILNSVQFSKTDTVLDLGCGNGSILKLITEKYGCDGIGVDTISPENSQRNERINYICDDMDRISDYSIVPTVVLSVDGLYFGCDLDKLLHTLSRMKIERICFFFSQYQFNESHDISILQCDKTVLGTALVDADIEYKTVDFSDNEYRLYLQTKKVLIKYESAFAHEGNSDLYEQKLHETELGISLYKRGLAKRYLYVGTFKGKP